MFRFGWPDFALLRSGPGLVRAACPSLANHDLARLRLGAISSNITDHGCDKIARAAYPPFGWSRLTASVWNSELLWLADAERDRELPREGKRRSHAALLGKPSWPNGQRQMLPLTYSCQSAFAHNWHCPFPPWRRDQESRLQTHRGHVHSIAIQRTRPTDRLDLSSRRNAISDQAGGGSVCAR